MPLLMIEDTTSLSYWLNWRALLCSLWVLTPMLVAIYILWKYERPTKHSESDTEPLRDQRSRILSDDDACWKPCIEAIPASLLLLYRLISFCLLLVALSFDVAAHGAALFHYYTQWTFTLVTVYFGLGSLLSLYGCCQHNRNAFGQSKFYGEDTEKGLYGPLVSEGATNGNTVERLGGKRKVSDPHCAGFLSCIFQILFQMTAGAVMLTDSVYWFVIFPFINIKNYEMSFLTVVAHSLNAILLFGDAALNSLAIRTIMLCSLMSALRPQLDGFLNLTGVQGDGHDYVDELHITGL
ncbi:OLC1v1011344C1 [Oldenlandia corymbosa var. corymbosa]|uniref:OLC1v1011344C1 n=1 Tax=Oldenlandia corymbosa var. corymbosa TaxID=529605 RepID=A0AAV1DTE5_OLDCO|nr:OLC1v1011344C1 [Oldenlandia corymbosa var. corymbosa]